MSEPKNIIKQLLWVSLFAAIAFLGYAYVGVFGQILSIKLVLNHLIPEHSVYILGELFAGIAVGAIGALAVLALRHKANHVHAFLGAATTTLVIFVLIPWPSNNLLRVAGDLTYILAVWAVSWALLTALTTRSRPTPSARP